MLKTISARAQKIFFFLVASQVPSFLFKHFLLLSQYTTLLCPFTFLSFFLSSFSPPFFPFYSPFFRFFFLFLFFLFGKFEHLSYLPCSAAMTLHGFLSPSRQWICCVVVYSGHVCLQIDTWTCYKSQEKGE